MSSPQWSCKGHEPTMLKKHPIKSAQWNGKDDCWLMFGFAGWWAAEHQISFGAAAQAQLTNLN